MGQSATDLRAEFLALRAKGITPRAPIALSELTSEGAPTRARARVPARYLEGQTDTERRVSLLRELAKLEHNLSKQPRELGEVRLQALEDMLQGAPKDPGPIAPGLLGWSRGDCLAVCSNCAGRIMQRGFGTAFQGWDSVWTPNSFPGCDIRSCDN